MSNPNQKSIVSLEELKIFTLANQQFLPTSKDTHLRYANNKLRDRFAKQEHLMDEYNDAANDHNRLIEDLKADYAVLAEKTGEILRDEKGEIKMTPENDKKFRQEALELAKIWRVKSRELLAKEIEIVPHFVSNEIVRKLNLDISLINAFLKFTINPDYFDWLEKQIELDESK